MSRKLFWNVGKWKRDFIKVRETGQAYASQSGKYVKDKAAPVSVSLCNQCGYKSNDRIDNNRRAVLLSEICMQKAAWFMQPFQCNTSIWQTHKHLW